MNIKLISIIAGIILTIGVFLSKFKKKKSPVMIYGGDDERKIHLDYEKKSEEIKMENKPIETKEEALKELNRYRNVN